MLNLLILCLFAQSSQAFRALYLANNIGYSHLEYTGKLADVLVDAGHEVDFVVEIWDQNLNYNGSKKANIIKFVGKNMDKLEEVNKKMTMRNEAFDGDWDTKEWKMFGKYMGTHCDALLSDHQFLNYLRTRNYTVGLSEVFDGCSWAVFKLLGIKSTHETSAFTIREPTAMTSYNRIGPVKTYFDLFYNFYEYLLNRFYILNLECGPTNEVIKQHLGQDHPTMAEMQRHSSFVWLNTYEIMDFTRLNTPKIKHIGGIAVNKNPGKLNEQTEKIFKQAKSGVVLISFGSLVNTAYMKTEVRRQLLEAFARYPDYQFIWRLTEINDEILADIKNYTNNVHAFKWVQQTSILADSRTVAFLTHVGVNSLNEAVYYGVPLIAVPFFGQAIN
ncbi:Glucuronosyltransferase [Aphelenchoides bicaudatus]|nr:Glucuronosyltransferase [Aphelenchoides bicaudatus]